MPPKVASSGFFPLGLLIAELISLSSRGRAVPQPRRDDTQTAAALRHRDYTLLTLHLRMMPPATALFLSCRAASIKINRAALPLSFPVDLLLFPELPSGFKEPCCNVKQIYSPNRRITALQLLSQYSSQ